MRDVTKMASQLSKVTGDSMKWHQANSKSPPVQRNTVTYSAFPRLDGATAVTGNHEGDMAATTPGINDDDGEHPPWSQRSATGQLTTRLHLQQQQVRLLYMMGYLVHGYGVTIIIMGHG